MVIKFTLTRIGRIKNLEFNYLIRDKVELICF